MGIPNPFEKSIARKFLALFLERIIHNTGKAATGLTANRIFAHLL
jgi:hypothetical protein